LVKLHVIVKHWRYVQVLVPDIIGRGEHNGI
jgi:hypothetical protein